MANENVINTRIRLKSDTYANWGEHQDTFKPLPGEVCIVEVQTVNSDSQVAPTILFKVGSKKDPAGGAEESNLYTFAELPWASALAADVYPWAKERNFPMQRDPSETGEPGNAISSMRFENGKLVYTTTNVVTQEEFAAAMEANAEATAELAVTVLSEAQKNIAIALQEYKPSWNSLTDKPFEEKVFEGEIISNLNATDYGNGNFPTCSFTPELAYTVIWNGTTYENIICYNNGLYNILGGEDYPFYIDDDGGYGLYIEANDDTEDTFVVTVIGQQTELIKLDSKFVVNGIVDITSNSPAIAGADATYRFLVGKFYFGGTERRDSYCEIVEWDGIPVFAGEEVIQGDGPDFGYNGYYNIKDNTVYAYFGEDSIQKIKDWVDTSDLNELVKIAIKAALKAMSPGWQTMEELVNKIGNISSMSWGGVVDYPVAMWKQDALYLLLTTDMTIERNGLYLETEKGIGFTGSGNGAEVFNNLFNNAHGRGAHAEGNFTTADGDSSHAEGYNTVALGATSHAEGDGTEASGASAHAEGNGTEASGDNSHAEGINTIASAYATHAEGNNTQALASSAHAEGSGTKATTEFTHAEGFETEASGLVAHAEGWGTIANGGAQHVQGKFNQPNEHMAFIIGNGNSDIDRSNAVTVDWTGTAKFAGHVYANNDQMLATTSYVDNVAASIDLSKYALKSTTLAGYGITNAYTKNETEQAIADKIATIPPATWDALPDKPFYDKVFIYGPSTLTFTTTTVTINQIRNPIGLASCIIFDDITYEDVPCVIQEGYADYVPDVYIYGNPALEDNNKYEDNGLPVAIVFYKGGPGHIQVCVASDNLGEHTIAFYSKELQCLDEKFIPDTIARTSVTDSLQTQINTIMNNPDTEGIINSINEFTQYIEEHGEIAEGFKTDINKNKGDIAANASRIEALEAIDHEAYIGALDAVKSELQIDASNKTIVALAEAQKYTDEKLAAIPEFAPIATSGSIYDIAEGAHESTGVDDGVKYIIFDCGTATTVI